MPGLLVLLAECDQHILNETLAQISSLGDVIADRPGANLITVAIQGKNKQKTHKFTMQLVFKDNMGLILK